MNKIGAVKHYFISANNQISNIERVSSIFRTNKYQLEIVFRHVIKKMFLFSNFICKYKFFQFENSFFETYLSNCTFYIQSLIQAFILLNI